MTEKQVGHHLWIIVPEKKEEQSKYIRADKAIINNGGDLIFMAIEPSLDGKYGIENLVYAIAQGAWRRMYRALPNGEPLVEEE